MARSHADILGQMIGQQTITLAEALATVEAQAEEIARLKAEATSKPLVEAKKVKK